jgi:anaerobic dimethyl sulfoxide reductase subunit A
MDEPEGGTRIVTYKEFAKKGWWQVPRWSHDGMDFVPYKAFIDAPGVTANQPNTPSRRFEIYCGRLPAKYAEIGFTTKDALPTYIPAENGYEDSFVGGNIAGAKSEYPLQLLSVHPNRRTHGNHDQIQQLREVFVDTLWMNPLDAEARGLKNNDQVIISGKIKTTDHLKTGRKMLRRVTVTPTVMPGVLITVEGPWFKYNDTELDGAADTVDISGNPNTVTDDTLCGEGQMPWNTVLCEVEKYTGSKVPQPDYQWAFRLPKFAND